MHPFKMLVMFGITIAAVIVLIEFVAGELEYFETRHHRDSELPYSPQPARKVQH